MASNHSIRPLLSFAGVNSRCIEGYLNPDFADEYERWLEWAAAECPLPSEMWSRLRGECRQRDDTLFEVGAAYFLSARANLLVKEWSPIATGGKRGDFVLEWDSSLRPVHVEVKMPSRKSQLVAEVGQVEADAREKTGEWYRTGDGGSYSTVADLRQAIDRALPQLPGDRPTLLVIVEARILQILGSPDFLIRAGLDIYFQGDKACNLGAVAILNLRNPGGGHIQYRFKFSPNPNASPAAQLPGAVIDRLSKVQTINAA